MSDTVNYAAATKAKLIEGFDKVIAKLEKPDSWLQGEYGVPTTAQCSVGHLRTSFDWRSSITNERLYCDAKHILSTNLPKEYENEVVAWNDTPGRTREEVLAVFKKARASLDEAGKVEVTS